MKRHLILLGFTFLTSIFFVKISKAQDIHYAQYFNSPMNISPALIGVFKGDLRAAGNYRNQWSESNVHYNTFTGGVDMKVPRFNLGNGYFAAGALINYDHAGDSKLSNTQLALGGSYTQQLAEQHFVSLGVQVGFSNRRFEMGNLQFADQYNNGDVLLDTREDFNNTSNNIFNLNGGVNYHFQKPEKRTKADIGIGLYNINKPAYAFDDQRDKYMRMTVYGILEFQIMETMDLILNGVLQGEGPHEELIVGVAGRHHISQKRTRELSLQLGVHYRTDDAIYPHAQVNWRNLSLGLSYDINVSDYTDASNGRGGPEVYFQYLLTKVKPSELKICPIY